MNDLDEAFASLATMLQADGYALSVREQGADTLVARIEAGPDACADCLVPKSLMQVYITDALRKAGRADYSEITLLYPGETC